MTCSKCSSEMVKGSLTNHGMVWVEKITANKNLIKFLTGGVLVVAYRCPKCQNVELSTEPQG